MSTAAASPVPAAATSGPVEYALRMADDALILGHRLSEWCGHAHEHEEDLALGNIALDLLGQARLWLALAGQREGRGRDEDALAFLRDGTDFRNALLVEQPNGDFGVTIARQFFFDAWHVPLLDALARSTDDEMAAIAAKSVKEARYHLNHSSEWMIRLGDGTEESRRRMIDAVDAVWRFTGELFEDDEVTAQLSGDGRAPAPSDVRDTWSNTVRDVMAEATLPLPENDWMASGGRRGEHSEHLGYLLAEMQHLHRAHPGCRW